MSDATLHFRHNATRRRRVPMSWPRMRRPYLVCWQVTNTGASLWQGAIGMVLRVNILPSWFSGWERGKTLLQEEQGLVMAYDSAWQGRWGHGLWQRRAAGRC